MKYLKRDNLLVHRSVFITLGIMFIFFLCTIWYVSEPIRASKIDRYILYNIDDIWRYCHIRNSLKDILIFFNLYMKFIYTLIATIFFNIIPIGFSSLRLMNTFFSIGTLFMLYKITKILNFDNSFSILTILLTTIFPLYAFLSISSHSEMIFSFFLLTSILTLYKEKYTIFSAIIALMPLLRQEGILYLQIGIFLLIWKKCKIKFFLIALTPTLLWGLFNILSLKRSFLETFCYYLIDRPRPPMDTVIFLSQVKLMNYIGFYPLMILSSIGFLKKIFDKKYIIISLYTAVHLMFIVAVCIIVYLVTGCLFHEYRALVPILPLLSIYQVITFQWILEKLRITKKGKAMIFFLCVMAFFSILQLKQFQVDPKVVQDSLTYQQEKILKFSCAWLKNYLKQNKIENVYVEGSRLIHKAIRKVWMNLPKDINLYCSYKDFQILNPLTYKTIPEHSVKGIVITIDQDNIEFLVKPYYKLIKIFPEIPLYIYITD